MSFANHNNNFKRRKSNFSAKEPGVYFSNLSNKYVVRVKLPNGRVSSIGQFEDQEVANMRYEQETGITL